MQFGSDNHPGASPRVLEQLLRANAGHTHGYGDDEWTERARAALCQVFERDLEVYFVATGTAANALALAALVRPWQAILCHDQAHILNDESTAVELYTGGARLRGISGRAGKLTATHLREYLSSAGADVPHSALPGALSLSQSSELGLCYTPAELGALTELAHARGMAVHVDGARFANAVVATGASPAELSWRAGVDMLSLGATKNGCLAAEAILVFGAGPGEALAHLRKRGGHLLSKGRLFGAQLVGWLEHGHWLELARHANDQAQLLAHELATMPGVRLAWPVEANELFAVLPASMVGELREHGATFYDWPTSALPPELALEPTERLIRLVTSFATTDEHRQALCAIARAHRPA